LIVSDGANIGESEVVAAHQQLLPCSTRLRRLG
jgi:hypothetical protein